MKKLIIFFLILLGSIWLGSKIYQQPGYILIFYQHWVIETTLWFVALISLLAFLILYLLIRFLKGTADLPQRLEDWWQERKQRKAVQFLKNGYLDLHRGLLKKSEKRLLKSSRYQSLAFMSYLLLAQVADQQNVFEKRNHYLRRAKKQDKKMGYIAEALRAELLLKHHKPEEALQILVPLRAEYPKEALVLKLMAETYLYVGDWRALCSLLPDLKKYANLGKLKYLHLEKEAYLHSLKGQYYSDFEQMQIIWNKVPRSLRHDPEIVLAYAMQLNRWNRSEVAEELIRKELKKNFSNLLMEYYVTTRSKIPAKQLALSKKLLEENEQSPTSLKAMGVLCVRNKLWGQAKDYFTSSLKLQPDNEVYAALGYVYEKLGEKEKALIYYRKGLVAISH